MVNAFQHFAYLDGILYARIVWENGEIFVPPAQAIKTGDEDYRYPLREKCELQKNSMGQPICYKLKREYFQNIKMQEEGKYTIAVDEVIDDEYN